MKNVTDNIEGAGSIGDEGVGVISSTETMAEGWGDL